ncbi:MAG: MATE family efflux transporter [Alphaproteobacteria bacterium]|nr:MATE family efflux transporter [Alphaproteobacteria bacterium]
MSAEIPSIPKPLPYSTRGDLTTGPVHRHLVRLTLPMIWGLLAVISVQIVDAYFIAKLGTKELAAISFTFPVIMGITHLSFGLNIATASVVSRLIGEKRMEDAKRITLHTLILSVIVSGAVALLCFAFLDPLFALLGADDVTLPIIRQYMPLWLLGSVFLSVPSNGNSAIRAGGDSLGPALVMTIVAVVNLALAPVLIFGLLGAPALGVHGAAIATLCAYLSGFAAGLYLLIVRKKMIDLTRWQMDRFADSVKRLVFIAVPAGLTNTIQPAANAFIVGLLALHGPEAVAAQGIATRVEGFAMLAVMALAVGMAPVVGQNWGARDYGRVHSTIRLAIGFNMIWALSAAVLLALFARPLAEMFSSDPAVIGVAVLYFRTVPLSWAFGNLVFGWASAFNAMGKPQRSFAMIVVKFILMMVPAVYVGGAFWGIPGIFGAIATVNIVSGVGFHLLSRRACHAEGLKFAPSLTPAE